MRKFLAMALCLVMALSLCGVAGAEGFDGEIKIWVAEAVVDFTKAQVEAFKAAHPEYANMTVIVDPVGENDAASNMVADVQAGADIYGFANDQMARLMAANALIEMSEENAAIVTAENDAGSVGVVTVDGLLYAYPMTSDNGYFLYYDKSVVTDPSNLEAILADCEAAGKNFYMDVRNGWYQPAFFFGAGCTLTYANDLSSINCDYASENGLKALKSIIKVSNSPVFVNGSDATKATNLGALVSGTWDAENVQNILGENYAAVKLPTVDGYQLGSFSGCKLLGVKPQDDEAKLAACDALALWLTSEQAQIGRLELLGWGPANLVAKENDALKSNVALSALAAQSIYAIGQGQYPGGYWSLAEALGDDILADKYDNATDAELMDVLNNFQTTAGSYVEQ